MIDTLFVGLSKTIETGDFQYLMSAYIGVLREKGLNIDRLQIPMNKISGLRHPRYGVILLTYADDELIRCTFLMKVFNMQTKLGLIIFAIRLLLQF